MKKRAIVFALGLEAILFIIGMGAIFAGGVHPGGAIFGVLHMPGVLLIAITGIEFDDFSFIVLSIISQGLIFFSLAYGAQWLYFKAKGAK